MSKQEESEESGAVLPASERSVHDKEKRSEQLAVGVVLRRQLSSHPWADYSWKALSVLVGAAPMDPLGDWLTLEEGEDWADFHAGTLILCLHRKDTEAYKVNLTQDPPKVFVVLRAGDDLGSDHDHLPVEVTVSPYEAQDFLDSGEDLVEPVPMPAGLTAYLQSYVDTHHVDEPFYKRKRKPYDPRKERFAQGKSQEAETEDAPTDTAPQTDGNT